MSNKFYFGTSIKINNNIIDKIKNIKAVGGNFIQIFIIKPGIKNILEYDKKLDDLKDYLIKNNMKVVVHSSYLHNLARNWDKHSWWLNNLELEIKYAHNIGAIGIVVHFGKKLDLSINEAYNNMYTALIYIHNKTKEYKDIKIFLETSTGQSSEICYKLEDLAYFYKKISRNENKDIKNRIKLCIDTCHVFAAGYSLKTKKEVKLFLESFEELIGLKYVKLIHLNDSKVNVGCQIDRHENIAKGYIGLKGLKYLFNYFRKLKIPTILETPGDSYLSEISMLLKNIS